MARIITPAFCLILLVVATGFVLGMKTDRWSTSLELSQACDRMDRIPEKVGDWSADDSRLPPEETAGVGIERAVYRRYQNPRIGANVGVLLECGRGGPISVHTPDVCYAAAGYRMGGSQERVGPYFDGNDFWAAAFVKKETVLPKSLLVIWGWSRDGSKWSAPNNPRADFARYPSVYKLYIVKDSSSLISTDPAVRDFITTLLKELAIVLKAESE
jgi:hypothetical protein